MSAEITGDFIGMMFGMAFGFLLLILIPCTWLPLLFSPLFYPTYELQVSDCEIAKDIQTG